MKRNKPLHWKIFYAIGSFVIISMMFISCDEEGILQTTPVDFYTPQNSYVTAEDYETAVLQFYQDVRSNFHSSAGENDFPSLAYQATDMFYNHKNVGQFHDISSVLLPTNDNPIFHSMWEPAYRTIFDANVVINRAHSDENELTDEEARLFEAEAKFFRGYMYKMLANLYGGVPVILDEVTEPKRDFERATREQTYLQAASDLEFAAENLGNIDEVPDERINNLAAYHLLSEIYISLERWNDAIDAADEVIEHPNTSLMTERFGCCADQKALIPQYDTNVFWDLFRQGNQNRSSGNTEAIWVIQYEWEIPGGGSGGPLLERLFSPRSWQAKVDNADGSSPPLVPNPNAFTGGRSSGFIAPTKWFRETLWEESDSWDGDNWSERDDIRNSMSNIVRDFMVRNPASDHNGQFVYRDNLPIHMSSLNDTTRNLYPGVFWSQKVSTPGQQPAAAFLSNPVVEGDLSFSHRAFRDVYAIRLAETYLLRAEAYLGAGNTVNAANDINEVRSRAQAPLVSPGQVDIDYILDERARELNHEENRLLTLTRLGKYVERVRAHNPPIAVHIQDHHNLWPIPFSEIEKNLMGEMEQNPGY